MTIKPPCCPKPVAAKPAVVDKEVAVKSTQIHQVTTDVQGRTRFMPV